MSTSALPDLIDALVSAATTALPTVQVFDGIGVAHDPGNSYLLVGVDDTDGHRLATAGNATQEWAQIGARARDEEGWVSCAAVAWNGDSDAKAARDAAFAIVSEVETLLRANPSLGVTNVLWTSFGGRVGLSQDQTDAGARAIVAFRVNYRARI